MILSIFVQPVQWSLQFVTIIAMLFVFHYQGMRALRKVREDKVGWKDVLGGSSLAPLYRESINNDNSRSGSV